MTLKPIVSGCARALAWLWHKAVWITVACVLLVAAGVLTLRYWVLPNVDNYREQVALAVSKAAGQRVTIGTMTADWDGLRPRLNLGTVVVYDKIGRAALTLQRVDSTLSWLSVPLRSPRFHALDFYAPALNIRRDKAGVISVGGIEMGGDSSEGGFSDWVLSQRDIEIHNAVIDWTDEKRDAPTLQLRQVRLHLVNRGERHRFGLKALPPDAVAGPLDLRGDLTGKSLKNPADWSGRIFAQLDYADIAAWRTWVPFPFEMNRGAGAVRAWATIRDLTLLDLIADVQLSDVRTRFGKALPELDLSALSGRVTWKKSPKSIAFTTTQLALTTAGNLSLPAMDFSYKATTDAQGAPLSNEIKINAVDIAPLASLADHLPLGPEARRRLEELTPKGRLFDVTAAWEGALPEPAKYSARARFEDLAVNRYGTLPGLSGISGNLDASEKGGTLQVTSRAMTFDMPGLFKAPMAFDSVSGQANWSRDTRSNGSDQSFSLKLTNIAYANADIEGKLQGSYQSVPGQPGIADFTGNLTRADARRVVRYLPLPAGRSARDWLEAAFLAGSSSDVKFRLKGDLREFPFDDEKKGTFLVTAAITGGALHYGDSWPNIEKIEGELAFRGKRMDMHARQGTIQGVRLSGVRAEIPDLNATRVLTLTGEADGQTPEFLKFIASSPVSGYIDHFTDGMQAEGAGKLNLRLEMPLRNPERTRIVGGYQMTGNRLVIDSSVPPLEQLTGRLEFTEAGVNVPSASAIFFGGPLTIAGTTQRDGTIRMNLQGRANPDTVRRAGGPAWLTQVRGAADWTGAVTVRKKTVDMVLESTLQGLASSLPAPLLKTAAEAIPVRFERRFVNNERDQLTVSIGDIVNARLARHSEGKRIIIDRGNVRLGGGAAEEPDANRSGVFVSGNLKTVNADGWMKLTGSGTGTGAGDVSYNVAGIDIKIGELELHERKFGELAVMSSSVNAETTRYKLAGREIEGTVDWNTQGRGRVLARLQKFTLPAAIPGASPAARDSANDAQLPALDIQVENFQLGTKVLGKLELKAIQQDRDWRIEQLRVINSDGVLTADGLWQASLAIPRTQINVQWGVLDIGKMLGRLGYPDGVRRGIAEIGGTLSWNGGPQQIDYATLSGKVALRAVKGQFAKMEPGIGKLLGIISLQSLPRRLTLDFRDVFSDGFAFDEMLGEIKIDQGTAASDKFFISGPSAGVLMSGTVDLNRETQNLQVKVSPRISDGVSIATAVIGGPIAALAAFVAQKLFKDPLDDLISFRYAVTGSWADPVVTKIVPPPVQARSPE